MARHHDISRKQPKVTSKPSGFSAPRKMGPYYGHEETSLLCARFLAHVFACPDLPSGPSTAKPPVPSPPLAHFIAYILYRMKLHDSVTFGALYLLHRLKARFPAARGSSGHRLFLAAYMIASKVISDDTYSNKNGWAVVGQGMFALREINQMEREMCAYLEWQLNFEPGALKEFEEKVRRDFKGPGPYPLYEPKMPLPDPMPSTTPYNIRMGSTAPAPTFTAPSQQPPSMSPSRPMSSPVPVHAGAPPYSASSSVRAIKTYESPDYPMAISTPPVSSAHRVEVGSGRPGAQFTPFRNSSTAIAHMPTPVRPAPVHQPELRMMSKEPRNSDFYACLTPSLW